jgi:glycine cleavage system H protein
MNTPENLRYTPSDEWVRAESDGTVTVGISDYAQHELGELVYVELPEVGRQLQAGQMFGVVESVKAVGELLLPVLGEVVEINDAVTEDPTLINNSPYEDGWLVKVRTEAGFDLSGLMDAAAYAAYRA